MRWLRRLRRLELDSELNGPSQVGFCPRCWSAVWRVHRDAHRAWHDALDGAQEDTDGH